MINHTQVETQRNKLTTSLVETKKTLDETTSQLKEDLRKVVTRAEREQTMKLLNLQLYDLRMNEEATKTAARYGGACLEEFSADLNAQTITALSAITRTFPQLHSFSEYFRTEFIFKTRVPPFIP